MILQRAIATNGGSTMAQTRTDTWQMNYVHDQFRREFEQLPDLLRAVPAGDVTRAKIVGGHARLVTDFLHHHHQGEDEMLWPKLLSRCPDKLDQELIHRMESQHAHVSELIEQINALLPGWIASGNAADRDRLADLYNELQTPLDEHLREEEERVLPLVSEHISQEEWEQLGKANERSIPITKAMLMIGSMLEHQGPHTARFYAQLPLPLRAAYRLGGRRSYTRYQARLRGA